MTVYKYPELVKPYTPDLEKMIAAEYNMCIPALGLVKLGRISDAIFSAATVLGENVPFATLIIIVEAVEQCNKEFNAAQKEYADV